MSTKYKVFLSKVALPPLHPHQKLSQIFLSITLCELSKFDQKGIAYLRPIKYKFSLNAKEHQSVLKALMLITFSSPGCNQK